MSINKKGEKKNLKIIPFTYLDGKNKVNGKK